MAVAAGVGEAGGGEAVESAWKLAKQYFKITGKPGKYKVLSRSIAYHGTPQGALAITGIPAFKAPFDPPTPGGFRVPNTNFYRAPAPYDTDIKAFGDYCADRIAEAIDCARPATSISRVCNGTTMPDPKPSTRAEATMAGQFPTAQAWSPVQGNCCGQAGQKCSPNAARLLWTTATWQALNFSVASRTT